MGTNAGAAADFAAVKLFAVSTKGRASAPFSAIPFLFSMNAEALASALLAVRLQTNEY